MDIEVLLASGETDNIRGIDDTLIEENYLHVLKEIDGDEISGSMKVVVLQRPLDPGEEIELPSKPTDGWKVPGYVRPHMQVVDPPTKAVTYQLIGSYAPGMWMKVMYA